MTLLYIIATSNREEVLLTCNAPACYMRILLMRDHVLNCSASVSVCGPWSFFQYCEQLGDWVSVKFHEIVIERELWG